MLHFDYKQNVTFELEISYVYAKYLGVSVQY